MTLIGWAHQDCRDIDGVTSADGYACPDCEYRGRFVIARRLRRVHVSWIPLGGWRPAGGFMICPACRHSTELGKARYRDLRSVRREPEVSAALAEVDATVRRLRPVSASVPAARVVPTTSNDNAIAAPAATGRAEPFAFLRAQKSISLCEATSERQSHHDAQGRPAGLGRLDMVERLGVLRDAAVLTRPDFEALKTGVLAGHVPARLEELERLDGLRKRNFLTDAECRALTDDIVEQNVRQTEPRRDTADGEDTCSWTDSSWAAPTRDGPGGRSSSVTGSALAVTNSDGHRSSSA
jgi:hypothetical protein